HELDAAAFLRLELHPVRVCETAAGAHCVKATVPGIRAPQGQDGIDSVGREAARSSSDVCTLAIYDGIGTQPSDQRDAVFTRCGGQNARAAQLRKLERQVSDTTAGSVDDDGLPYLYAQRVVDSLQRGKPDGGNRAGMQQIEVRRQRRRIGPGNRNVLCVEAALRIVEAVAVDPLANLEAAYAPPDCSDDAG